jgi:hypothetical protein
MPKQPYWLRCRGSSLPHWGRIPVRVTVLNPRHFQLGAPAPTSQSPRVATASICAVIAIIGKEYAAALYQRSGDDQRRLDQRRRRATAHRRRPPACTTAQGRHDFPAVQSFSPPDREAQRDAVADDREKTPEAALCAGSLRPRCVHAPGPSAGDRAAGGSVREPAHPRVEASSSEWPSRWSKGRTGSVQTGVPADWPNLVKSQTWPSSSVGRAAD